MNELQIRAQGGQAQPSKLHLHVKERKERSNIQEYVVVYLALAMDYKGLYKTEKETRKREEQEGIGMNRF